MERGAAIHKEAEDFLKGVGKTVPESLKKFSDLAKKIRKLYKKKILGAIVEDNWSFTKDWGKTQWNNWADCYLRVKLDCAYYEDDSTLNIDDWKTGKFRPELNEDYVEQLELYALAALVLFPHVDKVIPRLRYVDGGETYPPIGTCTIYTRDDIDRLKKVWAKRVKPMMVDKIFAPKPNRWCTTCHFRKSNKGPCKF
jgi:hypothetical protein